MTVTQYTGARYVPVFGRVGDETADWDSSKSYEPLTIVLYQGNSYTSRQFVPSGVQITNGEYWALTGNYNAQVEQYRQDVRNMQQAVASNANAITAETNRAEAAENAIEQGVASNTNAITAETNRAKAAEAALQEAMGASEMKIVPPSIESAIPVFRYEYGKAEDAQGGCYVDNSYAIAFFGASYFKVVVYSLSGEVLSQKIVNIANYHANGIDYRDGQLIVAGSTENGNRIYKFPCNNNTLGVPTVINSTTFGHEYVWGFGFYKPGYYWFSEGLGQIYVIDENLENEQQIGVNPYNIYPEGLQQAVWYDLENDWFVSCRSNSATFFDADGNALGYAPMKKAYNSCWTEEVEQISRNGDWYYFHNNDMFYTELNAKKVGCVFKTFKDGSAPKFCLLQTQNEMGITLSSTAPAIFQQDSGGFNGGSLRYPKDVAAIAYDNPDVAFNLSLASDILDYRLVFNCGGYCNLGEHKIRGIVGLPPSTMTIYGAQTALESTDSWGNEVFWWCVGGNVSIISALPTVGSGKKFTNTYGGMVLVKKGYGSNANIGASNAAIVEMNN